MIDESDEMHPSATFTAAGPTRFAIQILNALGNAVIATDLDARILYWNRAARALYGRDDHEVLGRSLAEVDLTRFTSEQSEEISTSLATGQPWRGNATARRSDGTTFVAAMVTSPLHDETGALVGSVTASWVSAPHLTPERNRSGPAQDRAGRLAPGGGETVLLVDDELPVRKFAQRLLQRIGYLVVEASNGEEALEVAARHPGPIDLLLTDLTMPRMGGRELALRISERRPATCVVFMSGYAEGGVLPEAIGGIDTAFVAKPFTIDALASTVRKSLDDR